MAWLMRSVWLRVVNVAATMTLWVLRDVGPGLREVGAGLLRMISRPSRGLADSGWGLFDVTAGALAALVAVLPQVVGVFRPLTDQEIETTRQVYGDSLPWARIRIFHGSYVARLATWVRRAPTAVVTMRVVHVPSTFDTSAIPGQAWLVHELMHVWQGQHTGPSSMARALVGQLSAGYAYGGQSALRRHAARGLQAFNPEQQGDIMRDYYRHLAAGTDVRAYLPYVEQVRRATYQRR